MKSPWPRAPDLAIYPTPTTRLVLEMMTPHVAGSTVLDVGCGSGVLSLAAAALGAKKVVAVDIDPDAVAHAKENASLNGFQNIFFTPPQNSDLLLLNMIRSEQAAAWESVGHLHFGTIITSGIRVEDRENYLLLTQKWGLILQEERKEEDWLGFLFVLNKNIL